MLLLFLLLCLSLALFRSAAVARVLGTTTSFAPIPAPTSFLIPNFVSIANRSSDSCKNLDNCRTLLSTVWSCLGTIFACVWVAVHRNIPGPKQNWLGIRLEWLKVVLITLLVPEWILAWAVRQYLTANRLVRVLEKSRLSAKAAWERSKAIAANIQHNSRDEGDRVDSEIGSVEIPLNHIVFTTSGTTEEKMEREPFGKCLGALETSLGRTNESWTITHAFFVIMGGFHYYSDGEQLRPLHHGEVLKLVQHGGLVPPTSDELKDRSKGDGLSKGVAIVQTLWFVTQCISRRIEHLPITSLEVTTLAYTLITVAMYTAWWYKPLNISCPVRVLGEVVKPVGRDPASITWNRIFDYVLGGQDDRVKLSQLTRVPTFWSGGSDDDDVWDVWVADAIVLLVAMAFCFVHCIAWSNIFPSDAEQLLWRASAIIIVAVPVTLGLSTALSLCVSRRSKTLSDIIMFGSIAIGTIAYISARLILLVISFTTLRSLSFTTYQTVKWTTVIPHI